MSSVNNEFMDTIKLSFDSDNALNKIKLQLFKKKTNKLDINYRITKKADGQTPLLLTIEHYDDDPNKSKELCQLLIDNGADVNFPNNEEDKMTPLMLAVENGADDICKLLLDNGANINAQDHHGYTALMRAVNSTKIISTCQLLLKYKPDLNITDNYGETAISIADKDRKTYHNSQPIYELLTKYTNIPVKKQPKNKLIKQHH